MTVQQRDWLSGQIAAVRILAEAVEKTLVLHCRPAAAELRHVEYDCNQAALALEEAPLECDSYTGRGK